MKRLGWMIAMPLVCGTVAVQAQGPGMPPEFRAYLKQSQVRAADMPTPANAAAADATAMRQLAALRDTPRWALAQADGGRGILKAYSCAAGLVLDNQNASAVSVILSRYRTDLITATKVDSPTPRPFEQSGTAPCIDTPQAKKGAGANPTLQSAWGWTVAMILAGGLPDRAAALFARGRAYGESGAVCGFATASEVGKGRDLGAAMFARAEAEPEFTADLAKARAQLAALAANPAAPKPSAADCAGEAALLKSAL